MKKYVIALLVLVFCIITATLATAQDAIAPEGTKFRKGTAGARPKLAISEEHKTQLTALSLQRLKLQKEIIQQNADNGVIDQEKATLMIERIDKSIEAVKEGKWQGIKGSLGLARKGHVPGRYQKPGE